MNGTAFSQNPLMRGKSHHRCGQSGGSEQKMEYFEIGKQAIVAEVQREKSGPQT